MAGEIVTDLFGDARELPSGKRGRPAHRWSQKSENRVIMGLVMGYSDAEIASGLGVSTPTLRKYYFSALKQREMQRSRFELWRAEVLAEQAKTNPGAMKQLGQVIDKRDRHLAEARLRNSDDEKQRPIAKKVARAQAAERAVGNEDTGWDDLLKPGGVH